MLDSKSFTISQSFFKKSPQKIYLAKWDFRNATLYATGAGNLTFARLIFQPKKLFKMRYLFFIHSELECLDSRRLRTQQNEWISSINVQIRLLRLTLIYPYMPDRHFLYLCCKLEKGLTCCRARSSYMSNSIVELLLNTEL